MTRGKQQVQEPEGGKDSTFEPYICHSRGSSIQKLPKTDSIRYTFCIYYPLCTYSISSWDCVLGLAWLSFACTNSQTWFLGELLSSAYSGNEGGQKYVVLPLL